MFIDQDTLLQDYDAIQLEDAAEISLRGSREGQIDPLQRLLDDNFTETLWEYEGSKIGYEIPGQLHDAQVTALNEDSRHRMLFWGNQAGKTTEGAVDCVLLALGRHPVFKPKGPVTIWASALTWELWEQILLPELLTWIPDDRILKAPPPHLSAPGRRTITIRADDGTISRIIGKSAQQGARSYQSAKVHQVWFDEEHPESIWDEVQPRLVRFGGRTITTATPLLGLTWLYHRLYMGWKQGHLEDVWASHAGMADNPANTEEALEGVRSQYAGDPAQAKARLHGYFAQPAGLALSFYNAAHNLEHFSVDMRTEAAKQKWTHYGGIDWGYWRWAFVHGIVDRAGRMHVVREIFSQKESLEDRARKMAEHLDGWDAPKTIKIFGDRANPTDINEFNRELTRIGSPYRVRAVKAEHTARQASVSMLNNLFYGKNLLINRKLDQGAVWRRGMNAASDGQPMGGSRLLYEIGQWRYPIPKSDDEAQKQDPSDDTADGADAIAALRYMVMSHFKPPKIEKRPNPRPSPNVDLGLERIAELAKRHGLNA